MTYQKSTALSEYHKLESVLVHTAEQAFQSSEKIEREWQKLNFTERPDMKQAKAEYWNFLEILKKEGIDIYYLPGDQGLSLDSIYCRDASIVTDAGMIICRMGKYFRREEPESHRQFYELQGYPILGEIRTPGTLEGGDVTWIDKKTLVVGHSYRTNNEGIRQLIKLLEPLQVEVVVVDMPHYKGPDDVFHLMSVFSPVGQELAVVYSPLLPIGFRNLLLDWGYNLVEVPDDEFETMGCNVLALSDRRCLMLNGNKETEKRLLDAGCDVITYEGYDISVKGGGGPTCLTRPLSRLLG